MPKLCASGFLGLRPTLSSQPLVRASMSISPPTEYELEMLEDAQTQPLALAHAADGISDPLASGLLAPTGFVAALNQAAGNLTDGLRPFTPPGSAAVADGAHVAAWMQHVVSKLNAMHPRAASASARNP